MAGIYDTHCHLNDSIYIENEISSSDMANEARSHGVDIINNVGFDIKSSKIALVQAQKTKGVYAVIGVHPTQAHLFTKEAVETLRTLAHADKVVGIGETGLDYLRYGKKYQDPQMYLFKRQVRLAKELNLAISLHIRDVPGSIEAYIDVLNVLKEENYFRAVVHSFKNTWEVADMFIKHGVLIAINGHITKDKVLQKVVEQIPMNFLVVESDAPYETPQPYNKQTNEPKYLGLVVEWIARIKKMSRENIAEITRVNGTNLFKRIKE